VAIVKPDACIATREATKKKGSVFRRKETISDESVTRAQLTIWGLERSRIHLRIWRGFVGERGLYVPPKNASPRNFFKGVKGHTKGKKEMEGEFQRAPQRTHPRSGKYPLLRNRGREGGKRKHLELVRKNQKKIAG